MNGEKWNIYRILMEKSEKKTPLNEQRRRWVDKIKMDLRKIRRGDMGWIDLAVDSDQCRALLNTVMNLRVPENAGKFLSSCTIGGFSRRAQLHEVSLVSYISTIYHLDNDSVVK
jgi:hypothetical protein